MSRADQPHDFTARVERAKAITRQELHLQLARAEKALGYAVALSDSLRPVDWLRRPGPAGFYEANRTVRELDGEVARLRDQLDSLGGSDEAPGTVRRWPSRAEFARMTPAEINRFFASIGLSARVRDDGDAPLSGQDPDGAPSEPNSVSP